MSMEENTKCNLHVTQEGSEVSQKQFNIEFQPNSNLQKSLGN